MGFWEILSVIAAFICSVVATKSFIDLCRQFID